MTSKHLAYLFVSMWGAFWTSLAYAQAVDPVSLQFLPWASVIIAGGIAMWGGLVVTLNRLDHVYSTREFLKWLVRDLIGAAVAGWFIYFVGEWANFNIWFQALSLLAAGYGGSKVLEAASKRLIKKVEGDLS